MPGSARTAGRIALFIEGTGGIGRATATGLAAPDAGAATTGRDRRRDEDAADDLRAQGGPPFEVYATDVSTQAGVRRLATDVLRLRDISGELVGPDDDARCVLARSHRDVS